MLTWTPEQIPEKQRNLMSCLAFQGDDKAMATLLELERKVGFAARYRRVQQTLEELEQLVIDARFECTGPHARLTTGEYVRTLNKILALLRSIDEVNES